VPRPTDRTREPRQPAAERTHRSQIRTSGPATIRRTCAADRSQNEQRSSANDDLAADPAAGTAESASSITDRANATQL
jgi:hypothetical protein